MGRCIRAPEPEACCQGINSGGEAQRRQKQYPKVMTVRCVKEAGTPPKAQPPFSDGLKGSTATWKLKDK